MPSKGRAAIVCFPGIFYRGGAEQKIRKYLIDNNSIETVISLAPNLFFGTTIRACHHQNEGRLRCYLASY
jgi:type I restriction enzyme M protein